ncbi:hypothetical protein DTO282F9_5717 [Paecilomyces variotii]|nr:hypothetical protein DTO282F9_5717 [Paecilomyces variotii]
MAYPIGTSEWDMEIPSETPQTEAPQTETAPETVETGTMQMDTAELVQDPVIEQNGPRLSGTEHKEMLRDLGNRKSEERILFDGPMPRSVQFVREDGSLIPETPFIKNKGSDVRISVVGRPVAAKIRFKVFVRNVKDISKGLMHSINLMHTAYLEFDLHPPARSSMMGPHQSEVSEFEWEDKTSAAPGAKGTETTEQSNYIDIKFKTNGGVSCGLRHTNEQFDVETVDLLRHMNSFTYDTSTEARILRVRMYVDAEDVAGDRLKGMRDALRSISRQRPLQRAFFPYCARSDLIRCIYGQFASRQDVFQRWNPVAFPASDFFHNLDDGHVRLAYGAVLEDRVQKLHLNRLSKKQSKISFVSYSGKSVIAVVKIDKAGLNEKFVPEIMRGSDVVVPDNTPVTVTFCPKEGFNHKTVAGIVIPDYASIKQGDIYIAIHGTSIFKKARGLLTSPGDRLRWCTGNVEFSDNDAPIKRQVNCLELLHNTASHLWTSVFLNQELSGMEIIDPFAELDEVTVKAAFDAVLHLKKWTDQQLAVFKMIRQLRGGVGLIEGYPGCGKTTVLAALALLCHKAGLHVLIVTPSNAAVDAFTSELLSMAPEIDYVCVRQATIERTSMFGKKVDDEDDELSVKNFETLIVNLLGILKNSQYQKAQGDLRYSVFSHVDRHARKQLAAGERLLVRIGQEEDEELEEYPALGSDHNDEDESAEKDTREVIEAYSVFRDWIDCPPEKPESPSNSEQIQKLDLWKEQRSRFRKAYEAIANEIVKNTRIVACTDNLAGSPRIRKHFGTDTKGIVVISDEDGQAVEPNTWIPIVSLNQAKFVKASIRGGDRHQLPPLVVSDFQSPSMNEFSHQLTRSLYDRLLRTGFPSCIIRKQHRMRPEISRFPREFTYSGMLEDDPSVHDLTINPIFEQNLRGWINARAGCQMAFANDNMSLIALNVENGVCRKEEASNSRYNGHNCEVVVDFIRHLMAAKFDFTTYSVTILTPYAEQRSRYIKALIELAATKGVQWKHMVKVATVDSMQGHQSDCVIFDWVVSQAVRPSDLGFTVNNNRCNVGITRARSCLINVGNVGMLSGNYASKQQANSKQKGNVKPPPEVLEFWRYLAKKDVCYTLQSDLGQPWKPSDGISGAETEADQMDVKLQDDQAQDLGQPQEASDGISGADTQADQRDADVY